MKKVLLGLGILIVLLVAAGLYWKPQFSLYLVARDQTDPARTCYQGTAKINSMAISELSNGFENVCKKENGFSPCQYNVNEEDNSIAVGRPGSFGPDGFWIKDNVLSISLDLQGKASTDAFERGVRSVVREYGNVVTLQNGTFTVTSAHDCTGIVY